MSQQKLTELVSGTQISSGGDTTDVLKAGGLFALLAGGSIILVILLTVLVCALNYFLGKFIWGCMHSGASEEEKKKCGKLSLIFGIILGFWGILAGVLIMYLSKKKE